MSRLREKLPEIIFEGLFVVFAILLALAADEWKEDRERAQISERAMEGIEAELLANRSELLESHDPNRELLQVLQAEVAGVEPAEGLNVQFEYTLLSDAAWQTAQVTQAVHYADYDLVQQLAKLYDLQELFTENQRSVVEEMSRSISQMQGDPDDFARVMTGRLGIVMGVEAGLMALLDTMIVQMENR